MLYTGHGDAGFTTIIGGAALPKCHARLETIGALDEAQAQLGVARALLAATPWASPIQRVQRDLHLLMAEVATVSPGDQTTYVTERHLQALEFELAVWEGLIGGFSSFITPGDSLPGAHLHIARTVIRRAERQAVALHESEAAVHPLILQYLNRLSSWAFTLAVLVEMPQTATAAA